MFSNRCHFYLGYKREVSMFKFKRRDFLKTISMSAVVPASLLGLLNDAVGKSGRLLFSTIRSVPLFQIDTTLAPGVLDALSRPGVIFSFDDREHPDGAIKP